MANINNHTLEIYVNGIPIDLFDDGVNLRINKVINDPTKINTTQSEYSFTFNLPVTDINAKAFNYANISSKKNKFSGRYPAQVYADNILIFNGTIKVTSIEEGQFKCNLFQSKINTLETIFGETTMNEINWKVPFKGVSTINEVNADTSTKYFFPLVAYSLFNKVPQVTSSSGYRSYSDKYVIDYSNRFYYNSFIPSLNLVELLKKCCELKGYNLQGDIITDKILNDIYLSNYIDDEQDPLYNYGDKDMGELSFDVSFKNYTNNDGTIRFPLSYIDYMLAHPIPYPSAGRDYGNYTNFLVYSLLDDGLSNISNVVNESKLLVDGGIQIPADGWYEITLSANFGVSNSQGSLTDVYECTGFERASKDGNAPKIYEKVTKEYSLFNMPLEIQLIRYNSDDGDVESISHDLIYKGSYPNEYTLDSQRRAAQRTSSSSSDRVASRGGNSRPAPDRTATAYTYTNVTGSTEGQSVTTAVDPYNNPNFICGLSQSNWARSTAYIKNGYSWNYDDRTHNESLYNCNGYYYYTGITEGSGYEQSTINQNSLLGAANTQITSSGRFSNGTCRIIIKLAKNDMLVPYIQNRAYYDENDNVINYMIEATASIKLRAVAPDITSRNKLSYNMNSLFDKDLNLGNFNNNQQKISDFFNDVQKAFNLSFQQDGNNIIMNKQKINQKETAPVDIDKKVNTNDAIFNEIEFPRTIEVKYKIDTEEEGFYRSVEDNTTEEQMQSNNWKDYGDYGYQKVNISQADESTDLSQSLGFSYNWNRDFKVMDFEKYEETMTDKFPTVEFNNTISIPVIGKTEWWIEGLDYEGYASNDGRGLTQRMWFRNEPTDIEIPVNDTVDKTDDWYKITTTSNYKIYDSNIVYLNYNNGVNTLLGKYFNIDIDSGSEEVEIEVFLNPNEYKHISMGASVHFDDNIYKVLEIQGYDPSGTNPTKLKLLSY